MCPNMGREMLLVTLVGGNYTTPNVEYIFWNHRFVSKNGNFAFCFDLVTGRMREEGSPNQEDSTIEKTTVCAISARLAFSDHFFCF